MRNLALGTPIHNNFFLQERREERVAEDKGSFALGLSRNRSCLKTNLSKVGHLLQVSQGAWERSYLERQRQIFLTSGTSYFIVPIIKKF